MIFDPQAVKNNTLNNRLNPSGVLKSTLSVVIVFHTIIKVTFYAMWRRSVLVFELNVIQGWFPLFTNIQFIATEAGINAF